MNRNVCSQTRNICHVNAVYSSLVWFARTMDWMRAVIILAKKRRNRIGNICISSTLDVTKQALNLGHQLLMPRISSNISIIRLPTVPHPCPRPHHCTIMSQPYQPALVHLMSTVSCRSFHRRISSNITAHLLRTWHPNRQFRKSSINSTTCTFRRRHRRLLYIPLPVRLFYRTRLRLPSIAMLLICQHPNHYTITTLTSMVLDSPTTPWRALHHSISPARILG
jgi:hypothetical protein